MRQKEHPIIEGIRETKAQKERERTIEKNVLQWVKVLNENDPDRKEKLTKEATNVYLALSAEDKDEVIRKFDGIKIPEKNSSKEK